MSELIFNSDSSGNPEPPKIEFPCRYPIKVLGNAGPEFEQQVVEVLRRHASGITDQDVSQRASSKGRFTSITVHITATGKEQLSDIFIDLKKISAVKMVL